jgi:hypothetical protein
MSDEVLRKLSELLQISERIDERTDWHTVSLEGIGVSMKALQTASVEQSRQIAVNTERIATSLERFADKALSAAIAKTERDFNDDKNHSWDWKVAMAALVCLGIITGLLILAYTGKDFRASHAGTEISAGGK